MIYKLTPERGIFFYDSEAARIKNSETKSEVKLTPTQNLMLLILIKRGYIEAQDFSGSYQNLVTHVSHLREKLRKAQMFKVLKPNNESQYFPQFEYKEMKV